MTYQPLYLVPGVCKVDSVYSLATPFNFVQGRYAKGRYFDGNLYRFTAGFPEKMGGWVSFITSGLVGIPRALCPWLDWQKNVETAIGTESHLYAYVSATLHDITPKNYLKIGSLTNAIATTANQNSVVVTDASSQAAVGDWVFLSASAAVGGLTINGYYNVTASTPGTGYTVYSPLPATGTVGAGGGTIATQYARYKLVNPFAMTSGSATVTVTDASHGASTGDYVTFSGATAYQGITVNGEYQITYVNANTYTIQAANVASGNGAAGGGNVITIHNISFTSSEVTTPIAYGSGAYGLGPYGYGTTTQTVTNPEWTLAGYGNLLLANPVGGTIYFYDPSQGGWAYPLLNAPDGVNAMFVTPERFIIALGLTANSQTLSWPDQSDPTVWVSLATNTANSGRTVQGGTGLVGGIPVAPGLSLFWTDRCCFTLDYSGDSEVYHSPMAADNCGLLSALAAAAEGGVAYWMSDKDFWTFNGTVSALPSDDIRDYVFNAKNSTSVNLTYKAKARCGMNRQKKEVWFFYVSQQSSEVDSYVIYHIDQQCWSTGMLERTAWVDSQLVTTPIACDSTGYVYSHETGTDADGAAMDSWIQTGPIDISNGDVSMDVMGFVPDFERQTGDVNLTVLTRYYPQDTDTTNGPYAIADSDGTPLVDLRADGRMVAAKFESSVVGGDFRLGIIRFDLKPAGARR